MSDVTITQVPTEVVITETSAGETVVVNPVDDVKFITINEGTQGPRGPEGPQGPAGASGINESDLSFIFFQGVPSDRWIIDYPLTFVPSVTTVDSAGTEQIGDIEYVGQHRVIASFAVPFSGTAYLN